MHIASKLILILAASILLAGCGSSPNLTADIANRDQMEVASKTEVPLKVSGTKVLCSEANAQEASFCDTMAPDWKENSSPNFPFEITYANFDLNNDGIREVIVWESSWAGTSGGMLIILTQTKKGVHKIYEMQMTWSPIMILSDKHHGWKDIAFLRNGGGVKTEFVILESNGRRYSVGSTRKDRPKGEVVIGENWEQGYFGPMEK